MLISGIGSQAGASSIVGSDTLPSSPTARQVYVVPGTGMFVCLSNGTWTQLDQSDAGTVSGSGVTNRLTKWIDGTGSVLGDSGVADDGTNILALRPFATGYGLSTPAQLLVGPRISAASTISTAPRGILSAQYSADTAAARVNLQKARGTVGTPVIITTGDLLGQMIFRGYDGTAYLEMGSIAVTSTGTIATNRVPTTMTFATATDAGPSVLTTALTIGADQSVTHATTTVLTGVTTQSVGGTTSALTDLKINPTTKASGNLFDAQVNSVSKFLVDFSGATTLVGILTSNANTTFAEKIIRGASGTFGAAAVIGWYRADGTTNEGFVGYSSGDSQVLRLACNASGGSLEFQVDAQATALTLAATTKLATFAGGIAVVGKISTYNNIATEGYGVGAIQKFPAITGNQSGAVTVTTITPTVSGSVYRVWGVFTTTSGTNTGTVGFTLDYLDTQATTHTADIIPVVGAAGAFATTGTAASKEFHTAPYLITVNSGTAITLKTVVTGTVAYTVTGCIEQVR